MFFFFQNLNEYVEALITLKQKIINTEWVSLHEFGWASWTWHTSLGPESGPQRLTEASCPHREPSVGLYNEAHG